MACAHGHTFKCPLSFVVPETSTTCTRASASHSSFRNAFPLPRPVYAPGTCNDKIGTSGHGGKAPESQAATIKKRLQNQ